MGNQKLTGTIKRVNRMRLSAGNRKVQVGTQGVIHSHTGAIGPFKFETDLIFHNGEHVDFEVRPDGEVVNIKARSRPRYIRK